MIEFITKYWQFFAAGLILLALVSYWIFDIIKTKKAKAKQLEEMEAKLQKEELQNQEEPQNEKTLDTKQDSPEEEPKQTKPVEAKKETTSQNIYMVSYDKEKKDWVVKKRGSKRATKRTKTKKEALEFVKTLTENQGTNFMVKKKDGKFQKK